MADLQNKNKKNKQSKDDIKTSIVFTTEPQIDFVQNKRKSITQGENSIIKIMNPTNQYLSQLKNRVTNSQVIKQISKNLSTRAVDIQQKIQQGKIKIQKTTQEQQPSNPALMNVPYYEKKIIHKNIQDINNKKKIFEGELQELNNKILQYSQIAQQMKMKKSEQKKKFKQQQMQLKQKMIAEVNQKIKRWQSQTKLINEKKKIIQQTQREQQQKLKKMEMQSIQKQEAEYRENKRKKIQQKIKELEERRKERELLIKNSPKLKDPKYLELERQFMNKQKQQNQKLETVIKNKKSNHLINFQKIREHEKLYLETKNRSQSLKGLNNHAYHKSEFVMFLNKEEDKVKEDKQKQERRKKYEETLKKKIKINEGDQQKLQTQIRKDKLKHPIKYHFLKEKGFNDFQIYQEVKQFQIDLDNKKLGNSYLNQFKEKHKQLIQKKLKEKQQRNKNSSPDTPSVNKIPSQVSEPKYKNYLPQLSQKKLDQIQTIVRNKTDKNSKIQTLLTKSNQLEDQYLKKIKLFQNQSKSYNEAMKIQDDIDNLYLKSLKAKLACAELAL